MSETQTSTFSQLPVGAVFRVCWTFEPMRKVSETNAENAAHIQYHIAPWRPVRQDWYIEYEWNHPIGGPDGNS